MSILQSKYPKQIVLDTETTGISNSAEILQFSIIDLYGNTVLNTYCKPVRHRIWPMAERVNHISPKMVENAKVLPELYETLRDILENADEIIGYNTKFDMRMIENNFARWGLRIKIHAKIIDVMEMYMCRCYGRHRLIDCAKHFGFAFSAHDSLEDCRATLFCYKKLVK